MHYGVIRREEAYLLRRFGQALRQLSATYPSLVINPLASLHGLAELL